MRELTANEIMGIGGADVSFTAPLSGAAVNTVSNASAVGKMLALSFSAGYAVGTWLNQKFDLSTKILDALIG